MTLDPRSLELAVQLYGMPGAVVVAVSLAEMSPLSYLHLPFFCVA